MLFGMLSVIAQFETELRAERQREGIAKAQRAGVHFGRTKALTPEQAAELRALRAEGVTLAALRQRYAIGKTALYRYLGTRTRPVGPPVRRSGSWRWTPDGVLQDKACHLRAIILPGRGRYLLHCQQDSMPSN